MKQILPLFFILSLVLISCEKEHKEVVRFGDLEGTVLNEFGQPIEGAKIETESFSNISNSDGKYSFKNLSIKGYSVSASKPSFLTKVQKVNIIENEITILDLTLIAGKAFLDLSDSCLNVNFNHGSNDLKVLSNAGWTIENKSSWIECSKEIGEGNGSILIRWTENKGLIDRQDTIQFKSGRIVKSLIINQSSQIKLINYKGILGNKEIGISDSVFLKFNKPVIVNTIKSNSDYCVSDIKYNLVENNYGVRFTYDCGELGGNYPFTISVSDEKGDSFSINVNIQFYQSKLDIEGNITDLLLINDDREVLISTYNPSKIIRYSIELNSIIQSYDLSSSISPVKLSYNPYNSKVYIMGSDPNTTDITTTYVDRPEVFTINIESGVISKAFTVQPDEYDHPQVPSIFPIDLGFTQSGIGIILLMNDDASGLRWKLIDCTNNDSIYNYPGYNGIIDKYSYFENVYRNFDNSKLYLTEPYHLGEYGIFDGSSQNISILRPNSATGGHSITPYRKADKFYARQLYSQFIIDPGGNQSSISGFDSRHEGKADFSYRKNEESIIYLCEAKTFGYPPIPNSFYTLNYSDGSILKSCDLIEGLSGFSTTIDGKYAVAYKQNLGTSYSLYIFKTEDFY